MKLTIDIETYSAVDLRSAGMYRYAEDSTTGVYCMAFKADCNPTRIWVHPRHRLLAEVAGVDFESDDVVNALLKQADTIEAHNAPFEYTLWPLTGLDRLDLGKMRCSAVKAATHSLPRSLKEAGKALGLSTLKSDIGHGLMLKWCKPRAARKGECPENIYWHRDPGEFAKLCEYCKQDVEAEYALSNAVPDITPKEQLLWVLDLMINQRGIPIDKKGVESLLSILAKEERLLLDETKRLTSGMVASVRQRDNSLRWLKARGLTLTDLRSATVTNALENEHMEPDARRFLEIRQQLSLSSVAKLERMRQMLCKDNRIKGTMIFYGPHTGRWAGAGIQPQNLPRKSFEDVDSILQMDKETMEFMVGPIFETASGCIRGLICAAPGMEFICADYSSIESVILAWYAREKWKLDLFRAGKKVYPVLAKSIFKDKYDSNDKGQYLAGKVTELACGYQGWAAAMQVMAAGYGLQMSEEEAAAHAGAWREANPNIVRFWKYIETACLETVRTFEPKAVGAVKFYRDEEYLYCRIASGRVLHWYKPDICVKQTKFGQMKETVTYLGVNSLTKQWTRLYTYAGKLTENIVQATARDLLAGALFKLEKAGYPVVFHVHDEIVAEVPVGFGDLDSFCTLISQAPSWAKDCPISASGWRGRRYRKEH